MAFFGRFFGRAGSEAAGIALGATAVPALLPAAQYVVNEAWQLHPDRPPDVYTVALGVAQGQIPQPEAKTWANEQGISDAAFAALVNAANVGPGSAYAFELWRRGVIDPAGFRRALLRLGLEQEWIDDLVQVKDVLLDPSVIANAVHRGIMRDPSLIVRQPPTTPGQVPQVPPSPLDPTVEAAGSGLTHERLRVEVGTTGLPPGLIQMLQLLNRGVVTVDDVQRAVSQSNLRNEYMDVVLALARHLLTPVEYVDAHLRGYLTQQQMYDGTALHGMTQADTDTLFKSHGRPITVRQIVTGEARGGTYNGPTTGIPPEFIAALKESSVKPPYYNLAYANRYTYPSAFVLRSLAEAGDLGNTTAVENILLDIGWPPFLAAKVAPRWTPTGAATDPYVKKAQTQLWTTLHSSYVNGDTDAPTAQTTLGTLGVAAAARPQVLALWDAEKALTRKELTPKQLKDAYQGGVINPATGTPYTQAEVIGELVLRGYSPADATTFLSL